MEGKMHRESLLCCKTETEGSEEDRAVYPPMEKTGTEKRETAWQHTQRVQQMCSTGSVKDSFIILGDQNNKSLWVHINHNSLSL